MIEKEQEQQEVFERRLGYTKDQVWQMAAELEQLKKSIGLCISGGFLDEKKFDEAQNFVSTFFPKK